jgi:hypothetical protein
MSATNPSPTADFSEPLESQPIRVGAFCAGAASGHTAAVPAKEMMNSRRFMSGPIGDDIIAAQADA